MGGGQGSPDLILVLGGQTQFFEYLVKNSLDLFVFLCGLDELRKVRAAPESCPPRRGGGIFLEWGASGRGKSHEWGRFQFLKKCPCKNKEILEADPELGQGGRTPPPRL